MGRLVVCWLSRFFCLITKLLKICERTHKSSINIRLAAAKAFHLRNSIRRVQLVYFHSRVWHTICHSPKRVYFTAQECEENEGGMCNVFKYINEFFQAISSISEVFLRILYNKSTYDCLNLKHKTPLSYKKSKTRVF